MSLHRLLLKQCWCTISRLLALGTFRTRTSHITDTTFLQTLTGWLGAECAGP